MPKLTERVIDGVEYLSISATAKAIQRETRTLHNWYKWADIHPEEAARRQLPQPLRIGPLGDRYWKKSDIPALRKFRDSIKYGEMSDVSRNSWGERGKKAQEN